MTTLRDFVLFLQQQYQQPYKLGRISQDEYRAIISVFTDAYESNPETAALAARALIVELTPAYTPLARSVQTPENKVRITMLPFDPNPKATITKWVNSPDGSPQPWVVTCWNCRQTADLGHSSEQSILTAAAHALGWQESPEHGWLCTTCKPGNA